MEILIRDKKAEDLPLIFDSYLKSWRTNKAAGTIPNHLFFEVQRTLLEDLIGRGAVVKIAYPEGHEDLILGWAMAEQKEGKTVLHYLYVKDPYLGLGLPGLLLKCLPGEQPGFITHRLPLKETKEWRHTPEMARRKSL
jgi:hypothetical protein